MTTSPSTPYVTELSDDLMHKISRLTNLHHLVAELRKMDGELTTRLFRAQQAPKDTYEMARLVAAAARLGSLRQQLSEGQQMISQIGEEVANFTAV